MSKDINYLASGNDEQLVPFIMDGTCESTRKLLQKCIMLVLSDHDDVFRPDAVGLYENLKGANLQTATMEVIKNQLDLGANTVQISIKRDQSADDSLADDERLDTFTMDLLEIQDQSSLVVQFKAVTVAGTAASTVSTI